MENIKITAGNKDIYWTGSLISFNEEPIELDLNSFSIRFIFETSKSETNELRYEVENGRVMKFFLNNANNPLGIQLTEPFKMGTISDRELYINFSYRSMGDTKSALVVITLYLGGNV